MWSPTQIESNPDASAVRAMPSSSGQRTSRSTSGSWTPTWRRSCTRANVMRCGHACSDDVRPGSLRRRARRSARDPRCRGASGRAGGHAGVRARAFVQPARHVRRGREAAAGGGRQHGGAGDSIQRFVGLATPIVRAAARGARFTRVPWVPRASSTMSIGVTVKAGVRELQVLAALLAYRFEQETGALPEPALLQKLTLELYLSPRRTPDVWISASRSCVSPDAGSSAVRSAATPGARRASRSTRRNISTSRDAGLRRAPTAPRVVRSPLRRYAVPSALRHRSEEEALWQPR